MYYLLISNQLFHFSVIEKDTTKKKERNSAREKNQKGFTNK